MVLVGCYKACLMKSKAVEEIQDDELKSSHELLEAPPLLLMFEPISLKFGRKSHQPHEESPKREMKKPP